MWLVWTIAIIFLAVIGFGVIFGAPFVPTRQIWIHQALDLAKIDQNDVVVDLGSGDGAVLIESLKRGARRAIGYEVNPILVIWSRLRLAFFKMNCPKLRANKIVQKHQKRPLSEVRMVDFFYARLPRDTTVIYLFQVNRAMKKVPDFIRKNRAQIDAKRLRVVCFGFELPGEKVVGVNNGMRLYYF